MIKDAMLRTLFSELNNIYYIFKWVAIIQVWHGQTFQCQDHSTKIKGQGCLKILCCTILHGSEFLYPLKMEVIQAGNLHRQPFHGWGHSYWKPKGSNEQLSLHRENLCTEVLLTFLVIFHHN